MRTIAPHSHSKHDKPPLRDALLRRRPSHVLGLNSSLLAEVLVHLASAHRPLHRTENLPVQGRQMRSRANSGRVPWQRRGSYLRVAPLPGLHVRKRLRRLARAMARRRLDATDVQGAARSGAEALMADRTWTSSVRILLVEAMVAGRYERATSPRPGNPRGRCLHLGRRPRRRRRLLQQMTGVLGGPWPLQDHQECAQRHRRSQR